jgi:hypothetical protein
VNIAANNIGDVTVACTCKCITMLVFDNLARLESELPCLVGATLAVSLGAMHYKCAIFQGNGLERRRRTAVQTTPRSQV